VRRGELGGGRRKSFSTYMTLSQQEISIMPTYTNNKIIPTWDDSAKMRGGRWEGEGC